MLIKPNKMTLYFAKVTKTASEWEKAFYILYEASDQEGKNKLFRIYPELCLAWNEWFAVGDSYFDEFKRGA